MSRYIRRFRPGQHAFLCDYTGFKKYSEDKRIENDINGRLVVDKDEWSPHNPQLELHGYSDDMNVNDARPQAPLIFNTHVTPGDLARGTIRKL